jgi:release factor glutamine methyltransferase
VSVSIAAALRAARTHIPAAEASLLLAEVCGQSKAWLIAHDDEALPAEVATRFDSWVARRVAGEPVAYILGWREFFGHRFAVAPGVLIPRPETELLVEQGLAVIENTQRPRILDLGTGSGCIAISLALARSDAEVWAVDRSSAALEVAAHNATLLGANVRFLESDWLSAVPDQVFDLIVSNPPYIAPDDPHLSQGDLRFEPGSALAAGNAGLADLRHIVAAVQGRLSPGGWVLCEHGYDQGPTMRELVATAGLAPAQWQDLAGITRVTGGQAV